MRSASEPDEHALERGGERGGQARAADLDRGGDRLVEHVRLAAESRADRARRGFELEGTIHAGEAESTLRTEDATRERAELGRDVLDRTRGHGRVARHRGDLREPMSQPGEREADRLHARRLLGRQRIGDLGEALDDGAQRIAIVRVGRGPGRLMQARVRVEHGTDLGEHRGLAHDREVVVGKRGRPCEQEIRDLGMIVAQQRIAGARERGPHRAAQGRVIGGGARHQLAHRGEARAEIGVAGLAHAVEEADECAQPGDRAARRARRRRSPDVPRARAAPPRSPARARANSGARGIGLGGEREHRGQRVVGEQLAIELAQQAHRVAAIDRIVVGRALEPVRGGRDLVDRTRGPRAAPP